MLVPDKKVADKKTEEKEGEEKSQDHGPKAEPGKEPEHGSPNPSEITKTSQMPVALPSDKPLSLELDPADAQRRDSPERTSS
jgi:hypothetical protein